MPEERELSRTRMPSGLLRVLPGLLACLSACAGDSGSASRRGEAVLVSAASSLTDAFAAVEAAFEAAHPDVDVELNLASSAVLREQILGGAPVDVFASADEENMARLVEAGVVFATPRVFARNRLRIGVPAGNPAAVSGLGDFASERLLIGLCAARAPCGGYSDRLLAAAGVIPAVDTREPSARALLAKIEAGELDAGLVYATDVESSAGVVGIALSEDRDPPQAVYLLARMEGARSATAAEAFIAFVLSTGGREILSDHGFLAP